MPTALFRLRSILPCAFLLACFGPVVALADVPFVTSQTLSSTLRNNGTQGLGMLFHNTTGAPITITQLGRWVVSGNNQIHTLAIYDSTPTPTVLASVTVNCSGATPGQFLYGTLGTPFVLAAGASCFIVSSETIGGDLWYDSTGTVLSTTGLGDVLSAYVDTSTHNNGGSFTSFGPVSFQYSSPLSNWTKSGTVYTTDGSIYSVNSAIRDASPGDTVRIPAGTFTWGAGGTPLIVNKAITLAGAGSSNTTIAIAADAPSGTDGLIQIYDAAVIRDFTIQGSANFVSPFSASNVNGWRITNITSTPGATNASFIRIGGVYGLIDNCDITSGFGNTELIFGLGPNNSWQTATSFGTTNAVYIESCTFHGEGYVCDANSNARFVIRYCTITDDMKVDGHGLASNGTPPAQRGVRQMEVYGNHWSAVNNPPSAGAWVAMELRGGNNIVFNNVSDLIPAFAAIELRDYGYSAQFGGFNSVFQTLQNYPIRDQVGTGQDFIINATSLAVGRWALIDSVGTTDFTAIGAPANTVGTWFCATGPGSGTGTVSVNGITEPGYVFNNTKNGVAWGRTVTTPAAGAISLYQTQTANPSATFAETDIIQANREFFASAGFDPGAVGVSVGTTAQMNALNPGVVGYGFWVTDQGSWNLTLPANTSGLLYTWNGSAWVLKYTPLTYPHPLRKPPAPSNLIIGP